MARLLKRTGDRYVITHREGETDDHPWDTIGSNRGSPHAYSPCGFERHFECLYRPSAEQIMRTPRDEQRKQALQAAYRALDAFVERNGFYDALVAVGEPQAEGVNWRVRARLQGLIYRTDVLDDDSHESD